MKGLVLVFVGLVLLGTAVIVYFAFSGSVTVEGNTDPETAKWIAQYAVGGFLGLLGLLFVVFGVKARASARAEQARQQQIAATGIDAEGTVTFVDRNFLILVNQTPIYSIVEYTYQDANGATHTRRTDRVPSEIVIRKKIEVGSKIPVKYARESPSESIMLLA